MTADSVLVEAIALTSPSGKMSKRALKAAQERLRRDLFGPGLEYPSCTQPSDREAMLRQAQALRSLAARGLHPRRYLKRAIALEMKSKEEQS